METGILSEVLLPLAIGIGLLCQLVLLPALEFDLAGLFGLLEAADIPAELLRGETNPPPLIGGDDVDFPVHL